MQKVFTIFERQQKGLFHDLSKAKEGFHNISKTEEFHKPPKAEEDFRNISKAEKMFQNLRKSGFFRHLTLTTLTGIENIFFLRKCEKSLHGNSFRHD